MSSEIIQLLGQGIGYTVGLTVVTSILSLVVGIGIGGLRLSSSRVLRQLATVYVELFRNIPALVLIIFLAFALPNVFIPEMRQALFFENQLISWGRLLTGLPLPYYALAVTVALTLNSSAYLAELFRAGVGTIPSYVVDSARTLGASSWIVFRRLLVPQGVRAAFPAISTRLIHNMKNTALAAFVAVPEFFQATQAAITQTFQALQLLLLAALFYLCFSILMTLFFEAIERRIDNQPNVLLAEVR